MLRYHDKTGTDERGQGIVEFFAAILALLAVFTMVLEISWLCMHSVSLSEAAYAAANANTHSYRRTAEGNARRHLEKYYSHFDKSRLQVEVGTGLQEYYYDEYVWKQRQQKYWQVPMRFQMLKTDVSLQYDLPCLTVLGTAMLHGPVHIKAAASSYRVLEHSVAQ